jgi:hypothetical protein
LISLYLLADGFAARGDGALHDPQGTVAALLERLPAAERPGVLHLRAGWLDGEVDGMDRAAFAGAVRRAVCGEPVEGVESWSSDERIGALQVTVRGTRPERAGLPECPTAEVVEVVEVVEVAEVAEASEASEVAGVAGVAVVEAVEPREAGGGPRADGVAADRAAAGGKAVGGPAIDGTAGPVTAGESARGGRGRSSVNTMMLDLARVLDGYTDAREKQPDAAAESLLRDVAAGLIAAGGPGLTWTKPPTQAELRIVLTAGGEPGSASEQRAAPDEGAATVSNEGAASEQRAVSEPA